MSYLEERDPALYWLRQRKKRDDTERCNKRRTRPDGIGFNREGGAVGFDLRGHDEKMRAIIRRVRKEGRWRSEFEREMVMSWVNERNDVLRRLRLDRLGENLR